MTTLNESISHLLGRDADISSPKDLYAFSELTASAGYKIEMSKWSMYFWSHARDAVAHHKFVTYDGAMKFLAQHLIHEEMMR